MLGNSPYPDKGGHKMIKFGTDGWRAVIAQDFTFDNVKIVSQAVADYLKKQSDNNKVVIGYDCRFLSKEFAETTARVLAANDIKVVLSDRSVPTPTISFHCLHNKYDLGVVITASHNPAIFNGFKIKTKEGGSADKDVTEAVEKFCGNSPVKYIDLKEAQDKGKIEIKDLTSQQINFLKNFIDIKKVGKLKLKVLIDNMYGSGDKFMENILGKCNIKIEYLHNEFNPSFAGTNPEPIEKNVQELIKIMKKGKHDIALILDGDADRLAIVDGKGNYFDAQLILPLLAIHMVKNRKATGGIGKTVVGSNVIDLVAKSLNIPCYETAVGFKYISNLFKENRICIGGEEAGGIGVKGYIPERDGTVAFLLLLEMIALEKDSITNIIKQFYKQFGRWYYSKCSIPIKNIKKDIKDMPLPKKLLDQPVESVNTTDGIKIVAKDHWLMFRASGTEPIVRVYSEGRNKSKVEELVRLGTNMIYAL